MEAATQISEQGDKNNVGTKEEVLRCKLRSPEPGRLDWESSVTEDLLTRPCISSACNVGVSVKEPRLRNPDLSKATSM
jgi:hypothetical protein